MDRNKFNIVFVLSVLLFYAHASRCQLAVSEIKDRNERAKRNLEIIQKSYFGLFAEGIPTIYIYQTEIFNQSNLKEVTFNYLLIEPHLDYSKNYRTDNLTDSESQTRFEQTKSFLLQNFGVNFKTVFILPKLQEAENFLKEKKISTEKIYLQIPIPNTDVENKKIVLERDTLNPSLKEILKISEAEFSSQFRMSSSEYDSILRISSYNRSKMWAFQERLISELFEFDFMNVDSLVLSGQLKQNFSSDDVPVFFKEKIDQRLEYLKEKVPADQRPKVKGTKIFIGKSDKGFTTKRLWLNNMNSNIYISPLLVRAMLLDILSLYYPTFVKMESKENLFGAPVQLIGKNIPEKKDFGRRRVSSTTLELEVINISLDDAINRMLDFVLLHELAHIFLGPLADEEYCDCNALKILSSIDENPSFGIFSKLLLGSRGHYWEVNYKPLYKRYNILKNLQNQGNNLDCDQQ